MVYYHGDADNWAGRAPADTGCLTYAVYPLKRCDIVSKGWRREGGEVKKSYHGDADTGGVTLLMTQAA